MWMLFAAAGSTPNQQQTSSRSSAPTPRTPHPRTWPATLVRLRRGFTTLPTCGNRSVPTPADEVPQTATHTVRTGGADAGSRSTTTRFARPPSGAAPTAHSTPRHVERGGQRYRVQDTLDDSAEGRRPCRHAPCRGVVSDDPDAPTESQESRPALLRSTRCRDGSPPKAPNPAVRPARPRQDAASSQDALDPSDSVQSGHLGSAPSRSLSPPTHATSQSRSWMPVLPERAARPAATRPAPASHASAASTSRHSESPTHEAMLPSGCPPAARR